VREGAGYQGASGGRSRDPREKPEHFSALEWRGKGFCLCYEELHAVEFYQKGNRGNVEEP
jgi:hypothetical protein